MAKAYKVLNIGAGGNRGKGSLKKAPLDFREYLDKLNFSTK